MEAAAERNGSLGRIQGRIADIWIHHVQLLMPPGQEDTARGFYCEVLGLMEIDVPPQLSESGGCWFRADETNGDLSAEIHIAATTSFRPAEQAHPALLVGPTEVWVGLAEAVTAHGHGISWDHKHTLDDYVRFHCLDPFGNRIEVLTRAGNT